jgi:hypothetical protein
MAGNPITDAAVAIPNAVSAGRISRDCGMRAVTSLTGLRAQSRANAILGLLKQNALNGRPLENMIDAAIGAQPSSGSSPGGPSHGSGGSGGGGQVPVPPPKPASTGTVLGNLEAEVTGVAHYLPKAILTFLNYDIPGMKAVMDEHIESTGVFSDEELEQIQNDSSYLHKIAIDHFGKGVLFYGDSGKRNSIQHILGRVVGARQKGGPGKGVAVQLWVLLGELLEINANQGTLRASYSQAEYERGRGILLALYARESRRSACFSTCDKKKLKDDPNGAWDYSIPTEAANPDDFAGVGNTIKSNPLLMEVQGWGLSLLGGYNRILEDESNRLLAVIKMKDAHLRGLGGYAWISHIPFLNLHREKGPYLFINNRRSYERRRAWRTIPTGLAFGAATTFLTGGLSPLFSVPIIAATTFFGAFHPIATIATALGGWGIASLGVPGALAAGAGVVGAGLGGAGVYTTLRAIKVPKGKLWGAVLGAILGGSAAGLGTGHLLGLTPDGTGESPEQFRERVDAAAQQIRAQNQQRLGPAAPTLDSLPAPAPRAPPPPSCRTIDCFNSNDWNWGDQADELYANFQHSSAPAGPDQAPPGVASVHTDDETDHLTAYAV